MHNVYNNMFTNKILTTTMSDSINNKYTLIYTGKIGLWNVIYRLLVQKLITTRSKKLKLNPFVSKKNIFLNFGGWFHEFSPLCPIESVLVLIFSTFSH